MSGESRWPHTPLHRVTERGSYIVTTKTHRGAHHFRSPERLEFLQNTMLETAAKFGWRLSAWAIFSNHYHFVGSCEAEAQDLAGMVRELHSRTARFVNGLDDTPGRMVWHQYWDTHLSYERSYLARLRYVMENPVRHGLVLQAHDYRWCSAGWFEEAAPLPFQNTLKQFAIDRVNVPDGFDRPILEV